MAIQKTDREDQPKPTNEPAWAASPNHTQQRSRVLVATAVLVALSIVALLLAQAVDSVREAAERVH
jgi:hypothetical protein